MNEKLKELQAAHWAVDEELSELNRDRRERERQLQREIEATLITEFNEAILSLKAKVAEAKKAFDEERSRLAKEKPGHPYPLGTVMCEWEYESKWSRKMAKTGKEGIFEIVTNETQFPKNIEYRKEIGSYIVRILKKDGTPSLRIDTGWSWWKPKDESIKMKEEKKREIKV